MARVELVGIDDAPGAAQADLTYSILGPVAAALANTPDLLGPVLGFVEASLGSDSVGIRLKEIAVLRTSTLQGCKYGVDSHTVAALDAGLSRAEVQALRGETPLENAFTSASERAVIGWIDALAGATGSIPDDVWLAAREHFTERMLIEFSVAVGAAMFLSRFATGLELPTDAGVLRRLADEGLA